MPTRRELANAVRALSMDAVEQAKSGHPGAPMGMADIAEVLWNDFLKHNPANPHWPDRDRFVLSNGHASMLLYSLLHLSGYDLALDELKRFRRLGSKTPGHPEYHLTPGVETTTGPLGQGLANAVGMALAEKLLGRTFNRDGFNIVDHHTYVFLGDGCLMEGISHEACSLAGTLKLDKLIAIYDDNGISIDGEVEGWFTEDVKKRFESYGWRVLPAVDGHDSAAIKAAIETARNAAGKPTLICCKTTIGFGAPNKQGTEKSHGAPLGADEIAAARAALGWNYPPFEIPGEIYNGWSAMDAGKQAEQEWGNLFDAYEVAYPDLAAEFKRRTQGELPAQWQETVEAAIRAAADKTDEVASRKSSQITLDIYGPVLPELLGGSADLSVSNLTEWKQSVPVTPEGTGNYIHYGVREFAMSAMMNGMALHGGFIPYGGTFLMFSEYARNAVRMAALMNVRSIFVYSHDSIGLGEDGPTHQAVEQLATLRYIPNMAVWRPCDTVETLVAWQAAIERKNGPSAITTSRHNLPQQSRSAEQLDLIRRGGYILLEPAGAPEAIVIATGSEVGVAVEAAKKLNADGRRVRVVSMPCTAVFDAQDANYREFVLPSAVSKRVAVEAGISDYWRKYVGFDGKVIGVDTFGVSAPYADVFKHFGFTADNVVAVIKSLIG